MSNKNLIRYYIKLRKIETKVSVLWKHFPFNQFKQQICWNSFATISITFQQLQLTTRSIYGSEKLPKTLKPSKSFFTIESNFKSLIILSKNWIFWVNFTGTCFQEKNSTFEWKNIPTWIVSFVIVLTSVLTFAIFNTSYVLSPCIIILKNLPVIFFTIFCKTLAY